MLEAILSKESILFGLSRHFQTFLKILSLEKVKER